MLVEPAEVRHPYLASCHSLGLEKDPLEKPQENSGHVSPESITVHHRPIPTHGENRWNMTWMCWRTWFSQTMTFAAPEVNCSGKKSCRVLDTCMVMAVMPAKDLKLWRSLDQKVQTSHPRENGQMMTFPVQIATSPKMSTPYQKTRGPSCF